MGPQGIPRGPKGTQVDPRGSQGIPGDLRDLWGSFGTLCDARTPRDRAKTQSRSERYGRV